jgi:hypothetical protein
LKSRDEKWIEEQGSKYFADTQNKTKERSLLTRLVFLQFTRL